MAAFDAASQFFNVTFLRRLEDTNPNESTSGRCFWEYRHGKHAGHWSWWLGEKVIDGLLFWDREDGLGHCALADRRDYERAKEKVRLYEGRNK